MTAPMTGDSDTLRQFLARAGGMDLRDERLQWMILTWDLARFGATKECARVLLSLEGSVSLRAPRSPVLFHKGRLPTAGDVDTFAGADNDPLHEAENTTELLLAEDFHFVCRPLAVNCEAFATVGAATDPVELLEGFTDGRPVSQMLLQHINGVRASARDTHLDADWAAHFPGHVPGLLWAGR